MNHTGMKINLSFFLLLLSVIFFYSCTAPRFVHTPTALNNPFFSERNDSKLAAYISGGSHSGDGQPASNRVTGADFMGAYAISNHFALTGSLHTRNERNFYLPYRTGPFDSSFVSYKRNGWEAGLGYFKSLNKSKTITSNFYIGIGNGTYKIIDTGYIDTQKYSRAHTANPFKIYFQPSINFIFPAVRISTVCRVNVLKYRQVITDYTSDELVYFHLDGLNNKTLVFPEMGINLEFRLPQWPWVAIEGQVSVNFNDDNYYRARTLNASAGMVIEPYKLIVKKQKLNRQGDKKF